MATRLTLVPVDAMPDVPGFSVPANAYWILFRPTPLLGMARPTSATPWRALYDVGVRRIVCLTSDVPPYNPSPLTFAHSVALQDLFGGIAPNQPELERGKIEAAAARVAAALREGEGVVVHCAGGTGRTGTVLGAAVIALGLPAAAAIAHLQAVNEARGKTWPESAWQQELLLHL